MKTAIVFEAFREGYGIDQIQHPVTVGELRALLEDLDDDTLFVLSHDNGYTYGSLSRRATIREEREGEYDAEYDFQHDTEYDVIDELRIW